MTTETIQVDPAGDAPTSEAEIVCGCTALTLRQLRAMLRENPQFTFDEVLARTGAGSQCTACLPDLEYHFVTSAAPTRAPEPKISAGRLAKGMAPAAGIKAKLYALIDGVAPLWPRRLNGLVPVVAGAGIDQWFTVANQSLLYEGAVCAPPVDVFMRIRDAEGRVVATERRRVPSEGMLRINVSEPLVAASGASSGDGLVVGSLEVHRRAPRSGVWGTTRPQIELVLPRSAATVHTQAPGARPSGAFTTVCRPEDDRTFLTIVNAGGRRLSMRIAYLRADKSGRFENIGNHEIAVPPHGAHVHEVIVSESQREVSRGRLMRITWLATGEYKMHVICASPALDRLSIDHL